MAGFDFDDDALDDMDAAEMGTGSPYLVCFYSGGFKREDGHKLLTEFLEAAKKGGIKDQLILDHANEYNIKEEGYEPFVRYVDLLISKIDDVAKGRPVILFGHSRGCMATGAVATRLGRRVRKCYFVASQGSIVPGKVTEWERLTKRFKLGGQRSMLSWFAELQPDNLLLNRAAKAEEAERQEMIEGSKMLKSMVDIMTDQYMNGMFPDMKNKVIDKFPAHIAAISPLDDKNCQPDDIENYSKLTDGRFELLKFKATHMGILKDEKFHDAIIKDMLTYFVDM